ncbi:phenylalanine--tRNA ligase subunit alpha [Magnetococcales bacterium HHB-1]
MLEQLQLIEADALNILADAQSEAEVESVRIQFLGKKGPLTQLLRGLGKVAPEERRKIGQRANEIKKDILTQINHKKEVLQKEALEIRLKKEQIDVTLPGRKRELGGVHPVTRAREEIEQIFLRLGYQVASGPEIETDWHNFEALNIPADHPAREMHDTFYIPSDQQGRKRVLRTHTSPVQIRVMENQKPPLRVIAPGKVFRCDSDITHTPMFHQVEGFMVDHGVHFGQLKGLLIYFLKAFFEQDLPVRFRPSFFPFTEPSAEVDMGCLFCKGSGCRVCKGNGWLEVLGCGMIHPNVLKNVKIDSKTYSGFAFGMGVERLAMLKYGIGDLRTFFENDIRFLKQHAG